MKYIKIAFPFYRPIWNLIKVEESYNKRTPISLFKYYKNITKLHNNMYKNKNWSPALGIKGDLVKFISRIDHFEVYDHY